MESRARTDHIETGKYRRVKDSLVTEKTPDQKSIQYSLYNTLYHDGCEDFYNYLDWLDLTSVSKTLVLPFNKNFYYTAEDFQGLEVLINLKCINRLTDLNYFLNTIYSNLPDYCYFSGRFQDAKGVNKEIPGYTQYLENFKKSLTIDNNASALSRLTERVFRFFDSDSEISLNKDITRKLLKMAGFTVLDMTELNGKTYFCVQKRPKSD